MFCPNCGNNCQNANFCPNCGQDLRNVVISHSDSFPQEVPKKVEYPEPPIGRYFNHDHDYIELDGNSITIYRTPPLLKPTKRTVQYSQIKAISYVEAAKLKHGGFLSLQRREDSSPPKATFSDASNDDFSIVFSWRQNDTLLTVYEFLKSYADRATKNHQAEKWPTPAQQMIEEAIEAREYEKEKCYVPAQVLSASPETFDVKELAWYPGKKKDERKARTAELDKSGQVYCPKCLSTSISANQKGFGFARGAIGAAVGLDAGLIAGGIGSRKVICTCLKCGYQWKAGKK